MGRFALNSDSVNKALILLVFASGIIAFATLLLSISEGGDIPIRRPAASLWISFLKRFPHSAPLV